MKDGKTIRVLKKMNRIIMGGHTGTPEEFADKLGMQRSGFYFYRNIMRANGIPIEYSRTLRTYYYDADGELFIGFLPPPLKKML